jgi:hypothetical protein
MNKSTCIINGPSAPVNRFLKKLRNQNIKLVFGASLLSKQY